MRRDRRWLGALLLVLPTIGAAQIVPEADRGRALYENHCRVCHESWAHERVTRQIASRAELRRRVEGWALHSGLEWGDEEVEAVTEYLDRRFYDLTR